MGVSAGLFAALMFAMTGEGNMRSAATHTDDPGSGGATPSQVQTGGDRGNGPLELKPIQTRGTRLAITVLSAVIWNAIAWALLLRVYGNYKRTGAGLIPLSLVGVFALLGAMFLVGCFYTFLQLFAPVPRVSLSKSPLRPGESAMLSWEFPDTARLDELTLSLVAKESISSRNRDGTTTVTDRELEKTVLAQENHLHIRSGSVPFTLPEKITQERRGIGPVEWQIHLWAKGSWNVRLAEEYSLPVR